MEQRTDLMLHLDSKAYFSQFHIALFGVGGVGGFALEALVRSGFINIDIYDFDVIDESNLNRQIITSQSNIGNLKTAEAKLRAESINPSVNIKIINQFLSADDILRIDFTKYDYVLDCIDTITTKMAIIESCYQKQIKIISSMGTGNKLDPTKLEVIDIFKTTTCPLAKVIRRLCRDRGIKHVNVIASTEAPCNSGEVVGSMIFVPASAGLLMVSFMVRDLLEAKDEQD